jgi:polysaccharide biosynthesis transport protein
MSETNNDLEPLESSKKYINTPFKDLESEEIMNRFDKKKLYLGVQRHLPLLIASTLAFTALASYFSYYLSNTYKAESVVLYSEDLPKNLSGGFTMTNFTLSTVLDMVKLPANIQAVKAILGLELTTGQIEGMTDVPTPRNNSNLIRIVAKGDNPNLVVDVANTLAKVAVKGSQEFNQRQLQAALDNYKSELQITRQTLSNQLQEIEDFKKAHSYLEMTPDSTTLLTQLANLRNNLQQASLRYNGILVEYENLKREVGALPENVTVNSQEFRSPSSLQSRIFLIESALSEARSKYGKENPKIKVLESELSDLTSKLQGKEEDENGSGSEQFVEKNSSKEKLQVELMRMQSKVRSAQKMKQDLSASVIQLEKNLETLPAQQVAFSKLLQAKQITDEQVRFLNNAVENTRLLLNVPKGSLEMYQLAEKAKPLREGLIVDLLPFLGLLFGFGTGAFLSVLLEMSDHKLRTAKEIELSYTVPCMMIIPELSFNKEDGREKTLFFIRSLAERIEHLKKIPTKRENPKDNISVSFTSSQHGEGKSMLSYYLALYYERLGKNAILIESDPNSISSIGINPSDQHLALVDYLQGKAQINDIIIKGKPDRICIYHLEPSMKELLKSYLMSKLWESLKKDYDFIIVDTPNLLENDYTLNLNKMVDLPLFVIDSSHTNKKYVDQGLIQLDLFRVKPVGIILNRVLAAYIDDERIRWETKKTKGSFLEKMMFWK